MVHLDLLRDGPVVRATAAVYTALALQAMFLLAAAPGLVALWLLVPDGSNLGPAALCLVPVGPALSACLYGWRVRRLELGTTPARDFWRGWRMNAWPVLRWWAPACLALGVLGTNLAHLHVVAGPGPARVALASALGGVTAGLLLTMTHALVICSLFTLRTRDVLRLALHHLARFPLLTLRTLGLQLGLVAVVAVATEAPVLLLTTLVCALLLHQSRPLITDIEENYVS